MSMIIIILIVIICLRKSSILIITCQIDLFSHDQRGEEHSSLHNSKHTHATRVQNTTLYSDGTTHIKQHLSKGVQSNGSPCTNNNCSIDMSKVFDTINIHTLIRKLLQTNISDTINKFIANYIKGHEVYTTYRNHTSSQRQFKTGVPQGGVLSPTLFNIYPADHQFRSWPTQTTSPSHLHTHKHECSQQIHTTIPT